MTSHILVGRIWGAGSLLRRLWLKYHTAGLDAISMASNLSQTMAPKDVSSYATFLSRNELYHTEKPYTTDFPVDEIEGAEMTNHVYDIRPVTFHDARVAQKMFTLDENGFCYIKAKTSLRAQDATTERNEVMEQYTREIMDIIQEKFPEYHEIKFMDFQVRKRHPEFPNGDERRAEFRQPSTMVHADFSRKGAFLRMAEIFPDQESNYENRKFDLINVWRVLKGPNNDWPLALCDFSLINNEEDVTTNDVLHYTRVGENSLLHYSDVHRWYFLSDMREDDLIVLRNVDSEGVMPRGFHVSFHNPDSSTELRHSIEVRLVAFRDEGPEFIGQSVF